MQKRDAPLSTTDKKISQPQGSTPTGHPYHRKSIALITSNPGKVASFNQILKQYDLPFTIELLNAHYTENKELGATEGVVLEGAKFCAEKYKKPVLVQDTGLFIDTLNGFPGVNTKFTLEHLGNEGILKLMEIQQSRVCQRVFSLGYCTPGKQPVAFTGVVDGTISSSVQGKQGFGFDAIFIPEGHTKTFAQDRILQTINASVQLTVFIIIHVSGRSHNNKPKKLETHSELIGQ